jgi:hypothetical protein
MNARIGLDRCCRAACEGNLHLPFFSLNHRRNWLPLPGTLSLMDISQAWENKMEGENAGPLNGGALEQQQMFSGLDQQAG